MHQHTPSGSRTSRARVVVATVAALSAWAGMAMVVPSAEARGGLAVGAVPDLTWGISRAEMDRTVTLLRDAGAQWVRTNVSWSGGEPDAKGQLNTGWLADVDYGVKAARAAGIQVLMPVADGVPYWASADPAKYQDASGAHWNKYWQPTDPQDYANFVTAMVNRYKGMGVHAYQVWNEPNTTWFWPSGPSASQYLRMLKAAHGAVKAADPTATVVLGGLSKNDYVFLQALYDAGARSYFDVAAVHPFTGAVDPTWCWNEAGTTRYAMNAFCGIEEVEATMAANGDGAKPIWLTEFGWSTAATTYGVSEATQADYLSKALTKLATYPYVSVALWYNFRNTWWSHDDPGDLDADYGLLRTDFSKKPAYATLQAYTGGPPTTLTPTTLTPTTVAPTTVAPATTTTTKAPKGRKGR